MIKMKERGCGEIEEGAKERSEETNRGRQEEADEQTHNKKRELRAQTAHWGRRGWRRREGGGGRPLMVMEVFAVNGRLAAESWRGRFSD